MLSTLRWITNLTHFPVLSESRTVNRAGATTSIPRTFGNSVKTDRIDARKLVRFYAKGLLSFVTVPERDQEEVRDLLRTDSSFKAPVLFGVKVS